MSSGSRRSSRQVLSPFLSLPSFSPLPDEIVSTLTTTLSTSPDFSSEDDFRKRVTFYQSAYETVKEIEGSYIKVSLLFSRVLSLLLS